MLYCSTCKKILIATTCSWKSFSLYNDHERHIHIYGSILPRRVCICFGEGRKEETKNSTSAATMGHRRCKQKNQENINNNVNNNNTRPATNNSASSTTFNDHGNSQNRTTRTQRITLGRMQTRYRTRCTGR